jgi:hypothetical protein
MAGDAMSDDVLMKPATTLDDVLKEVRELREEVRKYQREIEIGAQIARLKQPGKICGAM